MAERQQLKAFVKPSAKSAVEAVCERYGMTQQEVVGRVYEWFAGEDEAVQVAVLGLLPRGHEADIASLILSGIAKKNYPRVAAKKATGQKSTPMKGVKSTPVRKPKA